MKNECYLILAIIYSCFDGVLVYLTLIEQNFIGVAIYSVKFICAIIMYKLFYMDAKMGEVYNTKYFQYGLIMMIIIGVLAIFNLIGILYY